MVERDRPDFPGGYVPPGTQRKYVPLRGKTHSGRAHDRSFYITNDPSELSPSYYVKGGHPSSSLNRDFEETGTHRHCSEFTPISPRGRAGDLAQRREALNQGLLRGYTDSNWMEEKKAEEDRPRAILDHRLQALPAYRGIPGLEVRDLPPIHSPT